MQGEGAQPGGTPSGWAPAPPPGPPPAAAGGNPGLAQAGVVLLLVGAIIEVVSVAASLLALLALRVFGGAVGGWGPMDGFGIWSWMPFGGLFGIMMAVAIVGGVAATVLLFLGWQAARGGALHHGGVLGIVGGAIATLGGLLGIVGLLGGIFCLVAGQPRRPAPVAAPGPAQA